MGFYKYIIILGTHKSDLSSTIAAPPLMGTLLLRRSCSGSADRDEYLPNSTAVLAMMSADGCFENADGHELL